jgi:hypothetical protein
MGILGEYWQYGRSIGLIISKNCGKPKKLGRFTQIKFPGIKAGHIDKVLILFYF